MCSCVKLVQKNDPSPHLPDRYKFRVFDSTIGHKKTSGLLSEWFLSNIRITLRPPIP